MMKRGYWLVLCIIVTLSFQQITRAEFSFQLSIDGRGSVLAFLNGTSGPPTEYFATPPNPLSSANSDVKLAAIPVGLDITDGVASLVTLQFGDDLQLDLQTVLGSKFVQWTGSLVVPTNPSDPDYQNPTENEYIIREPSPSTTESIQANFSSDISDVGIDEVRFSFDGGNNWIGASSWNFTGDDDPLLPPSPNGNILINMNWSDLLAHIDLNTTNRVELWITDKTGGNFIDAFDLDVNSPASVPEPASWVLVSVAALGALGWRRRSRRKRLG
jgi:hypothetical protein